MANILEQIAGNKTIANLAFKQIRKYIQSNKITFIAIYLDEKGDIGAKEYNEPMRIIKENDYNNMVDNISGLTGANAECQNIIDELESELQKIKDENLGLIKTLDKIK